MTQAMKSDAKPYKHERVCRSCGNTFETDHCDEPRCPICSERAKKALEAIVEGLLTFAKLPIFQIKTPLTFPTYEELVREFENHPVEDFQNFFKPEPIKPQTDVKVILNKHALILDACCGGKMFYFDKEDPRVLFQDKRNIETTLCDGRHFEVKPDILGDFTNMPYPDNYFKMVVFDPPHLKKTSDKEAASGWQMIKYGYLGQGWQETIRKGFAECFRVLAKYGFLIFKWNETDIPLSKILELTDQKPIFGHKSGKRSNTHWICFMKYE